MCFNIDTKTRLPSKIDICLKCTKFLASQLRVKLLGYLIC